ncbi:MAG: hypothetical protein ACM3TU_02615 [Bacillota bacterium]
MQFEWHTVLGMAGSLLLILLAYPYIRSIVKDTTRPSAVSWLGWALLFGITSAAQFSKGVDWSLAVPVISTLSTSIIFVFALFIGRIVWTRFDALCLFLAVLAVVLWLITKEPLTAIVLSMAADFFVTIPTLIKTYQDPTSEPRILWTLYTLGALLEVLATQELTIYNLLFPIYTVLGSGSIALLSWRAVGQRT